MAAYEVLFCLMLLIFGVGLIYPWHPSWPAARVTVHLPWLLLPMWGLYEVMLPSGMNIRLDLLLFFWIGLVAAVVYLMKLLLFSALKKRTHSD